MSLAKPIIDRRLYSSSLPNISVRHVRFLNRISLSLKQKNLNFFQYAKIRKSIKICSAFAMHEIYENSTVLFNLAISISNSFQKSVRSLIITLVPLHQLPYLGFKNAKKIDLTFEGKKAISNAQINSLVRKILISPKLENIELDPAIWRNIHNLKRLSHIKSITMNSKSVDFLKEKDLKLFEKLKQVDFSLSLDIDSPSHLENLINFKSILEKCQNLTLRQCIPQEHKIRVLPEILPFTKHLKFLRYTQESCLLNPKQEILTALHSILTLQRLELEFNFAEIGNAEKFFDSLSLPSSLVWLKMNFNKCKKEHFSKLSFQERFFTDLEQLPLLRNLDFQIAKLFLNSINSDAFFLQIINVITRATKDLTYLKLTTTGTSKNDEQLLSEVMKFEKLSYLSLDMFINFSDKSLASVREKALIVKNLSIYDNLLLLHLPNTSLRNVEELCIYISPDSFVANKEKVREGEYAEYERGPYILKKILNMRNVRNISLYFFKKDLFNQAKDFIEGIVAILNELKYLESLFVLVWSIEVNMEEAERIENCFRHNKMINFVYIMVGITTIGRDAKRCSYTSIL